MKVFQLLFVLMSLPAIHYAQICSANPGGDQTICVSDPMTLYGEDSDFYLHPLEIEWEVVSAASPVTISDPFSLQTTVLSDDPGGDFVIGDYVFRLTVTCIDGEHTSNEVTVSTRAILTPATILTPSTTKVESCDPLVTFTGSAPDNGVNGTWSITPDVNVDLIPTANGGVTVSHTGSGACEYTLTYFQTVGSCESFDEVDITFTRSHPSVNIGYIDPAGCPTCTRRIRVGGTAPGCNGTPVWTVSPSAGVQIETPNSQNTWINFDETGVYDISYTIDNGDCPTSSVTSTCEINEIPGFEIGPNENYLSCSDSWDYETLELSVNDMPGVEYQWSVVATNGTGWINILNPNASSTIVEFSGVPLDLTGGGIAVSFAITATYNNCVDSKSINFFYNPTIDVETEDVYLLCGGDQSLMLSDYYTLTGGASHGLVEVLAAPPDNNLPPTFFSGTFNIDLTVEGTYSFLINASASATSYETGQSIICTDQGILNILVADIPTINAGSDIVTCLTSTELNGNTPLNVQGEEVDIPVLWELTSGQTGVSLMENNEENPVVTGLQNGETYSFLYSFSQVPGCIIEDEMLLTVKPADACENCTIDVEVISECIEGCVQLSLSGNAEEYMWVPSDNVDDSDPTMPVICDPVGGTYLVIGLKNGEACSSEVVEVPACSDDCIPLEGDAILVYAGCAPDIGPNTVEYDIILPDFPMVPISDITVTGGGQVYYDALGRLHYNGSLIACGEICFTIYIDEECAQSHCIDLPTCLGTPCNDLYYIPQGYCNSIEGNFAFGVDVFYISNPNSPASEIYSVNEENALEFDQNTFSDPDLSGWQYSSLEFWGSTVNENGVIPLVIQVLGPFGQVLCEDRRQFNPEYFCDDQSLIDYIFLGGDFPGGGEGEGKERNQALTIGQNNQQQKAFDIYPVPATNYIHIENPDGQLLNITISDLSGKEVYKASATAATLITLPVRQLAEGMYLVHLTDAKGLTLDQQKIPVMH